MISKPVIDQVQFRIVVFTVFAIIAALLAGCGHGSATLPPLGSALGSSSARHVQSGAVAGSDVVAINVSGPAVGTFSADMDGTGGTTSSTSATIDTSAANAAPAAVYQTQRYGPMTYTIPGLMPGNVYDVRLHFAELYWGLAGRPGAGSRQFNITINGMREATNFDIFATAGAPDKAVVTDYPMAANANGQIVIALANGAADFAALNALEIIATSSSPTPAMAVHVGGGAVGAFLPDMNGQGGSIGTTSDAVSAAAPNAAPAALYQAQRWGPMTYTMPGFTPGVTYDVRLHFSEMYWGVDGHPGGAGSRRFDVTINGKMVQKNLDVYAAAGGPNKAYVLDAPMAADANGTFTIALTNDAADNAMLSGIQIVPTSTSLVDVQALNVGGATVGVFAADTAPNGGSNGTISTTSATIVTSAANAAPAAVYQSQRYGPMQRTFTGLTPGAAYTVRLHFAELYFGLAGRPGTGQRQFNVAINGSNVLTNFDVYAAAGAADTAVVRDLPVSADGSGTISLALTNGNADNPMLSGVEILGNAAAGATQAPIVVPTEMPHPSDTLADAVGINTHFSEYGTLYGNNFGLMAQLLQYAGIRHVRDGAPGRNPQLCANEASLSASGIGVDLIANGNPVDTSVSLACLGGTVEQMEGLNEYDLSGDPSWAADLRAATSALAAMTQLPLVAPSLTSEGAAQALGSMAPMVAYGNAHVYFSGRNPGTPGWGGTDAYGTYGSLTQALNVSGIVSGSRTVQMTESGYSDAVDQYALPAATKARYLVRTLLEAFNAGVARTYIYELLDEGATPFSHYGIVDANGNPKPAYVAVANLLHHVSDRGGAFSPAPLGYALAAPAGVHHLLLQRRSGGYELIVWNEAPEWDPNANAPVAAPAQPVALTFANAPSSIVQTSFNDDGSTNSAALPSNQVVTLSASGWPTILDISP